MTALGNITSNEQPVSTIIGQTTDRPSPSLIVTSMVGNPKSGSIAPIINAKHYSYRQPCFG